MDNFSPLYRLKDDVNLFDDLKLLGFLYSGNYNRGDKWERKMIGIDKTEPQNGIVIHGDWDNRRIYFMFPYRNELLNKSVYPYIEDLVNLGIVEQER